MPLAVDVGNVNDALLHGADINLRIDPLIIDSKERHDAHGTSTAGRPESPRTSQAR